MSDDDDSSGMTGKLIKWTIILILTGMTGGTFLILYLGWKYVKLCILFYFKALYFIIRMPIWLFIQLPLHYLGVGVHKTSQSLKEAYGVISMKRKRYGTLFGLLSLFMIYTFLPRNTDAMISFLTDATLILPLLGLIPFTITFLIAFISAHASSPDIARKDMPGGLNTGMKERTATAGAAAAAVGQAGLKGYNSVEGDNMAEKAENAKESVETAKKGVNTVKNFAESGEAETLLADDMVAVLGDMPFMSSLLGGAGEAAGMASTATAASGGTILVAIAALLIGFLIINAILAALTFWIAGIVIPMIIGPIMGPVLGALGLGQAYGNWFGSEIANNLLPQVDFTAEMRMIEQAGAKVSCALQGPACLRQWRMNNTARPGSEDVGEKYRVEVQEFDVGGQGGVDIAYKQPSYEIPVSFLLLNTRHGLKGIDADDVKYRIRIGDADRSGKKAYCSTSEGDNEWVPIQGTFGSEGSLLPGTSFSPRLGQISELNIGNCEMLTAALGHDYTAELDVKYDYSSQATLYVEAMSRQNMRDNEITPSFKKSETADTPVETFINLKAPITYITSSNNDGGGARSIPFTVKVGTLTDRLDIEYRVDRDNFKFYDSSKTVNAEGSCNGLASTDRNNEYRLSDRAQERIDSRIEPEDTTTWFDKAKSPAPARCTFNLENPGSISPTGETLTMRVDANYTVIVEQTSDPFEVKNTMCSQYQCPILFYLEANEFDDVIASELPPDKFLGSENPQVAPDYEKYKNASCDGIDAGSGCSATKKYQVSYTETEITKEEGDDPTEAGMLFDNAIREDELAVKWSKDTSEKGQIFACGIRGDNYTTITDTGHPRVVGVPEEGIEETYGTPNKVLEYSNGDFVVNDYERTITNQVGPDIFSVEYNKELKAVGCENGKPKYEVACSALDSNGLFTATTAGLVIEAVNDDSCGNTNNNN